MMVVLVEAQAGVLPTIEFYLTTEKIIEKPW
jgi:hypothetical protein